MKIVQAGQKSPQTAASFLSGSANREVFISCPPLREEVLCISLFGGIERS
jgi:hypothetical protein